MVINKKASKKLFIDSINLSHVITESSIILAKYWQALFYKYM